MPYSNVPADKQDAMESCVTQVQGQGYDKEAAIAICYSSVVKGAALEAAIAEFNAPRATAPIAAHRQTRGELIRLAQAVADTTKTLTIQVLRAGEFTDMHGKDFTLTAQDLDAYVANSNALLESEQVPIEIGHPSDSGAPAAAWYRKFFRKLVDGVEWICAEIELTALGADSLAEKLYKYFSAVIWIDDRVISGGGFVNRPAVSGQQPVGSLSAAYLTPHKSQERKDMNEAKLEMSQEEIQQKLWEALREKYGDPLNEYGGSYPWLEGTFADHVIVNKEGELFRIDYIVDAATGEVVLGDPVRVEKIYQPVQAPAAPTAETQTETPPAEMSDPSAPSQSVTLTEPEAQARIEAARAEERARALAQQAEFEARLAQARADERERVQAELARRGEIRAFAQQVTMGKRALPFTPAEVESTLDAIPDAQREQVQQMLAKIVKSGTVDLSEIGDAQGAARKALDDVQTGALKAHLARGGNLKNFFKANGLDLAAYDVSAFEK